MNKQDKEMKIEEMEAISGGRRVRVFGGFKVSRRGIDIGPVFSPTSPFGNSRVGIIPLPSP